MSVHSDDSNADNQSINSTIETSPSENGQRIRPTRPAPAIPQGLSRNTIRRSAPQPPRRQSAIDSNDEPPATPQAAPRRSAPSLEQSNSVHDNTNVRMRENVAE